MEERIRAIFREEGFVPLCEREDEGRLPPEDQDIFEPRHLVTVEEIGELFDRRAPYRNIGFSQSHEAFVEQTLAVAMVIAQRRPRVALYGGCGTGLILAALADRFPDTRFLCNDVSGVSIDLARALVSRRGIRNAELWHAPHHDLRATLEAESVDLIFTVNSLDAGMVEIPCFMEYDEDDGLRGRMLDDFLQNDLYAQRWMEALSAFRALVAPSGALVVSGLMRGMMREAIEAAAAHCGWSAPEAVHECRSYHDDYFEENDHSVYADYARARVLTLLFHPQAR